MHNSTLLPIHVAVREVSAVLLLMAVVFGPGVIAALAHRGPAASTDQAAAQAAPAGTPPPAAAPAGAHPQLPDLVSVLKGMPGVLGVEAARTASGKQVLFAWFENKQAVVNWVNSEPHQAVMRRYAPAASTGRAPLAAIADDSGPILTIASITMSQSPAVDGVHLPVAQIAIELYAPLPGGLAAGGRFAPDAVKVPGLLEAPASSPSPQ